MLFETGFILLFGLHTEREAHVNVFIKDVHSTELVKNGTLSQFLTKTDNQDVKCVLEHIKTRNRV